MIRSIRVGVTSGLLAASVGKEGEGEREGGREGRRGVIHSWPDTPGLPHLIVIVLRGIERR